LLTGTCQPPCISRIRGCGWPPGRARTEREYFAEQAGRTSELIHRLGWPLAILLSFGALAGAVNAIHAVTSVRSAQIATLRALGFQRQAIFLGALAEACMVAVGAGLVGILVAYAIFSGLRTTLGSGITEVALSLEFTLPLLLQALLLAVLIGAVGGMLPAWSAARRPMSPDLRG
jgi:putative ABC transport system permease protein